MAKSRRTGSTPTAAERPPLVSGVQRPESPLSIAAALLRHPERWLRHRTPNRSTTTPQTNMYDCMPNNRTPISQASSCKEIGEFWDREELTNHLDQTREVQMDVELFSVAKAERQRPPNE